MTDKPYACSKCNYTSDSKSNTNKHIRTKKGCEGAELIKNIIIIKCEICEKEYNDQVSLKQHKSSCVAKRTITVEKYKDVDSVKQWSDGINLIVKDFSKRFELLENYNKELKTRIERLEKEKKKDPNFEEAEKDCEDRCNYYMNVGPRVTNREELFRYLGFEDKINTKAKFWIDETMKIGFIQGTYIKIDNEFFVFDKNTKKKGEKLATELFIYNLEECTEFATKYSYKHKCYTCEKHIEHFK